MTPISDRHICRSIVYQARVAICRGLGGVFWFCVERYTPAGKRWDPEVEVTPKSPVWIAIEIAAGLRDEDGQPIAEEAGKERSKQ